MPQVLVRFMGIRSADEVKKSRVIAVVWCVVSLACGICIGLVGRVIIPSTSPRSSGRKRVHRAVPDDLAAVHVRRGGVGHLRGVDELLVLVLADAGSSVAENIFRGVVKKRRPPTARS